jgi:hypothetical protein
MPVNLVDDDGGDHQSGVAPVRARRRVVPVGVGGAGSSPGPPGSMSVVAPAGTPLASCATCAALPLTTSLDMTETLGSTGSASD